MSHPILPGQTWLTLDWSQVMGTFFSQGNEIGSFQRKGELLLAYVTATTGGVHSMEGKQLVDLTEMYEITFMVQGHQNKGNDVPNSLIFM